jgi:beta-lactamase regulating signal transducer with metallopeptidase domain
MAQLLAAYLASLILRSIGIAFVAGICSCKIRNVAVRHAVWVAVLAAMLLMPAADFLLPASWVPTRIQQIAPKQSVPIRVASPVETIATIPAAPAALPSRAAVVDWWSVAAALYAMVTFAMFIRLAMGYRKMRKLRGTARAITSSVGQEIVASQRFGSRTPGLLESEAAQVPMTIGFIRPVVILPVDWKNWDDWKLRAVLLHELAHVRRVDWGVGVIAAAAKCAYWLNPVSWFLERQLSQLAEQASDDATLSNTQNPTRYAEILLEFAVAAQNGGRLMKGGIAMAQPNMKSRIVRVLGNTKTGTGIVNVAGWMIVMIAAAPMIYSAAALRATPEPVKSRVAASPEFRRNPLPQTSARAQAASLPSPATATEAHQTPDSISADMELPESRTETLIRGRSEVRIEVPVKPDGRYEFGNVPPGNYIVRMYPPSSEPQNANSKVATEQNQANPPVPAPPDALLNLPDTGEDLRAYLSKLAQLRHSFSMSVTGIQGRTINMNVAGQDYSFGCENCSFFAGESAVSSASPAPSEPGILVRLSADGSNLNITCHAAKCSFWDYEVLGVGSEQLSNPRQLESGLSQLFQSSKRLRVVISKN